MTLSIHTEILGIADVKAIIELLHQVYGDAYILDWMYNEKQLKAAITEDHYTFIGVKVINSLVGMLSISYTDPSNFVAELSTLVVHPSFRHYKQGEIIRRLVNFFKEKLNKEAKENSLTVLLARPVTKHVLAQKLMDFLNMEPVGITYCTRPSERDLQRVRENAHFDYHDINIIRYDQVVSAFYYPSKLSVLKLSLDENILSIIRELYDDQRVETIVHETLPYPSNEFLEIKKEPRRSFVCFNYRYGCQDVHNLFKSINAFSEKSYRVLHVYLNIGEYNNQSVIKVLSSFGFYYSALIPCFYGESGHALVLQYLNGSVPQIKLKNFISKKARMLHKRLVDNKDVKI